jgi:nucleotide-binding universal stress UspA family protein
MTMWKSLLIATDFSDSARHAAYRGAMLAAEQDAQLHLLHVMSRSSLNALQEVLRSHPSAEAVLIEDVRAMLNDLAAQISAKTKVAVQSSVEVGDVLEEILAACERADMLIVGARGVNPIREMLLGTTAERLLRRCRRPMLVVKRAPLSSYASVLVPVDFSAHSLAALQLAARAAPGASMTVAHAFDVPFEGKLRLADVSHEEIERYRAFIRQRALGDICRLVAQLGDDVRHCNRVVEQGDPRRLIIDQEKALRTDMIVIGKHGSVIEDLLIGSVTRHVLSASHCDVLVETSGVHRESSNHSSA